MTDRRPDDMPQAPRDYDDASYSELVPIKSSSISIIKSPLFYVVAATGVLTMALVYGMFSFGQTSSVKALINYGLVAIAYLLLIVLALVYLYSRSDKPFWAFAISFGIVSIIFMTPLIQFILTPFRFWMPRSWIGNNLISHYIWMFFGAGMAEEFLKSIPGLIGAWLAVKGTHLREKSARLYDWMVVRGPLDGLMMGVFAGAAFIFFETGFEYFPRQFAQNPDAAKGLSGLMLLIPRVSGGMVGHMCWAGITGYFIGLVVMRPNAWKFALYAWVGSSAIHAMWNSLGFVALFGPLSIGIGGLVFVACFLKAKQMDQSLGRQQDGYGSIVVQPDDRPSPSPAAAPAPDATAAPPPPPQSALFLQSGAVRLPVVPGQQLDFGPLKEAGLGVDGLGAEVTTHPTRKDVLGLKNTGDRPWAVTLRDGSQIELETGRNIRLAPGVKINLGNDVTLDVYESGA